ncbi:hypothetical protein [Mesorhizobium sp. M1396]|uniref:hypothetical protein n=1 Tax=unclassified Mesorhizobium TaxID=325217 RepID=UPI00333B5DDC
MFSTSTTTFVSSLFFEQTAAIQPSGDGVDLPEAIFAGALLIAGVLSATQDDVSVPRG